MKSVMTIACICFLLLSVSSNAQDVTKSKFQVSNKAFDYYEMRTDVSVKGILILLPAKGEEPKSIFSKTALPKLMAGNGYITVIPDIPTQMFADNATIEILNELYKIKMAQYNVDHKDIVMGGLSNGGAMTLCYTEYLNSQPIPIKLKASFAIDCPADLARIYSSAEKKISYNCGLIAREGKQIKAYLNKTLGGSHMLKPQTYIRSSAFSAQAPDGGNARYLKDVAVRLYSEPDLEYVRKTYCEELQFSDLNTYDFEKLITFLKAAGNDRASYIPTKGKGFHTWNIVDPADCVKWINSL